MARRQTGGQDKLSEGLRAARKAAGLASTYAAATRTGKTQSMISRVESGATLPAPGLVKELCEAYGTRRDERDRLVSLAEDMRAGARRVIISKRPSVQARIGRIQDQSALVRGFASIGLPGTLQTEDYALNLMSARGGRTPAAIAAAEQRVKNQELLDEPGSARRWVYVLAEGALGWAFGDSEIMAAQMGHLIEATRRRNLRLGVVPFGAWDPDLPLPLNGWEMYDGRHVIVGTVSMTADLQQPAHLAAYVSMFERLERLAVYDDAARAILRGAADRYRAL
jgi:transcriptional regulator with XRE-family HTH domain